jgi:hypothetical protein
MAYFTVAIVLPAIKIPVYFIEDPCILLLSLNRNFFWIKEIIFSY